MIRLTGMNSGLDTEAMIQELSKAYKTKVNKVKGKQTESNWLQEKWKDLNGKIAKFYTSLDNLKYTSSYASKKTTASESGVANIITNSNAPLGSYTLNVKQVAGYANMTGNELEGNVKSSTKLSELGIEGSGSFEVAYGGKTKTINYNENTTIDNLKSEIAKTGLQVNFDENNKRFFISSKTAGDKSNFEFKNDTSNVLEKIGLDSAIYNEGKNAKITLNGANYESTSNTFEINGLTIQALKETSGNVQITTEQDTSGVYDRIKNFIKSYNELVIEIDKAYNADSSKGYNVLTEDEKEQMTDKEIEEWEKKIKSGLLRNNETLGGIYKTLRSSMLSSFKMADGTTMSLSDFGIETLGYFNAPKNERSVLHIDGDKDDDTNSSKTNKLEALLKTNPEKVAEYFSDLSKKMYNELSKKCSSVNGTRSFGTFYEDKKLKADYDTITKKVAEEEKKMNNYMDKYYKQFARMETVLAKTNSQSSYLSGLFGG